MFRVEAIHLMRDSYSLLYSHCPQMLSRSQYNLAARCAYDAMEKVAQAVQLLSNVKVPRLKHHEYELTADMLSMVPLIAWDVDADPMSSVSLIADKYRVPLPHIRFLKCIAGVVTQLATCRTPQLEGLRLVKQGSTIRIWADSLLQLCITDTAAGCRLDGRWVQLTLDDHQIGVLNKYLQPLKVGRNLTGYYGEITSASGAIAIWKDGCSLFSPLKRRVGDLEVDE